MLETGRIVEAEVTFIVEQNDVRDRKPSLSVFHTIPSPEVTASRRILYLVK
jgi:hypothetical protein